MMIREIPPMLRVVCSIVVVLLLCGWVLPSHGDTESQLAATIHCADFGEADTPALTIQNGPLAVRLHVKSCSLSYASLTSLLLASKIYRPPQA
jgi:hypothetical protein